MIDHVIEKTNDFVLSKPKNVRKSYGQFFTPKSTAQFMASLFDFSGKDKVSILDPGAGSGILSAAIMEAVNGLFPAIKEVELTCYETNTDILPLLEANLEFLKRSSRVNLAINMIKDNYLLSQSDAFSGRFMMSSVQKKYDMVIGNPPYFKLHKDAPEAASMPEVCYGAPNIYFLFASMSLFNLREDGEMVYIVPRSWTSGAYFSRFRNYLLDNGKLTDIHVFTSRNKVFNSESILQETMIMKLRKTQITPTEVFKEL